MRDQIPTLLVCLYALLTVLIGFLDYPPGQRAAAVALRLVGRLAAARFDNSPGTWHVPGTAQPPPMDMLDLLDDLPGFVRNRTPPPPPPPPTPPALKVVLALLFLSSTLWACTLLKQGTVADTLQQQAATLQDQLLQVAELRAAGLAGAAREAVVQKYTKDLATCLDESSEAHGLFLAAQKLRAASTADPLQEVHANAVLTLAQRDCAAGLAAAQLLLPADGGAGGAAGVAAVPDLSAVAPAVFHPSTVGRAPTAPAAIDGGTRG